MGYTIIKGERNSVEAEVLFFVPVKTNCEVQKVKLTNNSDRKKIIKTLFICGILFVECSR